MIVIAIHVKKKHFKYISTKVCSGQKTLPLKFLLISLGFVLDVTSQAGISEKALCQLQPA